MKNKIKKFFNKDTVYYIESLIYICSIIIVVMANVFGPVWVKMIPLLFILGIIGKIVFDRPIVTTIFGSIVSLCVIYISGVTNLLENILNSLIFTIYIALGEVFGTEIKQLYERYYVDKKRDNKKVAKSLVLSLVVFLLCTLFHNYTDSNIFMYNNAKSRLKRYLLLNYPEQKFEILSASYDYKNEKNFKFNVMDENTADNYKFIVYIDRKLNIYDGIEESSISKKISQMNGLFKEIIGDKLSDIEKSISQINEVYEINLSKQVLKIEQEELLQFSKEISQILNNVIDDGRLKDIEQVNISLINKNDKKESRIATVYMNGYIKNKEEKLQKDYSYIMKALDIEYID